MVSIDFTKPWSHDDVTLEFTDEYGEQKELHASRAFLEIWSPAFKAMLKDGHFKEGETKKVDLTGKNYDDVLELLKVMHPTNTVVTLSNAYKLLPLAHEYQMDDIVSKCEAQIMSKHPSIMNLHTALTYRLAKLENHCMEGVSKRWSLYRIQNDPSYYSLPDKVKFEILENKICKLEGLMSDGKIQKCTYGSSRSTCPCSDTCMCQQLPKDSKKAEEFYKDVSKEMRSRHITEVSSGDETESSGDETD